MPPSHAQATPVSISSLHTAMRTSASCICLQPTTAARSLGGPQTSLRCKTFSAVAPALQRQTASTTPAEPAAAPCCTAAASAAVRMMPAVADTLGWAVDEVERRAALPPARACRAEALPGRSHPASILKPTPTPLKRPRRLPYTISPTAYSTCPAASPPSPSLTEPGIMPDGSGLHGRRVAPCAADRLSLVINESRMLLRDDAITAQG